MYVHVYNRDMCILAYLHIYMQHIDLMPALACSYAYIRIHVHVCARCQFLMTWVTNNRVPLLPITHDSLSITNLSGLLLLEAKA